MDTLLQAPAYRKDQLYTNLSLLDSDDLFRSGCQKISHFIRMHNQLRPELTTDLKPNLSMIKIHSQMRLHRTFQGQCSCQF